MQSHFLTRSPFDPNPSTQNIPTPVVTLVADYDKTTKSDYVPPVSYIRLTKKKDPDESPDHLEYCLEYKDVVWMQSLNTLGRKRELLDEDKLERMIDILEKATGVAPAISQVRACAAWKGLERQGVRGPFTLHTPPAR